MQSPGSQDIEVGEPSPPPSLIEGRDQTRERIAVSRSSMRLEAWELELLGTRRDRHEFDQDEARVVPAVTLAHPRPSLAQWLCTWRLPARVGFVGIAIYLFAFNLSMVRGSSMAPGIHDGDRILIDHVSYLFGSAERGDIVVLRYPLDPSVDYIKRVVGLPGDEVVLAGGELWVNGDRVEEGYVAEPDARTHTFTRVKPGHYFVLGDNRPHSSDSREFGQVPSELIRGKVELRLWPPGRIGALD